MKRTLKKIHFSWLVIVISSLFTFPTPTCCSGKPKLLDFKRNVYSQFGEDGIIEKIFEIIGTTSKTAIEFGSADGFNCSNTANLWTKKDLGWKGILIEANKNLFEQTVANVSQYNCVALHKTVGISATDSLEAILTEANLNLVSVDLLSIDIDGNDYYIFQSLKQLRPRVIICEYNVSIPAHLDIYPDSNNYIGCSVAALQRVAAEKNYSLVAITDTNCFFVANEEIHKFAEFDTDPEHIKINKYILYVVSDYKGHYKTIGATTNFYDAWGWTGIQSSQKLNGSCITISSKITR